METTLVYFSGYSWIMERKMETTIVYLGSSGIMENKLESTITGYIRHVQWLKPKEGLRRARPDVWGPDILSSVLLTTPALLSPF